jgi:pantetheine-phosphate adenylyltransferase
VADFEYEFQMVGMNRRLDASIETVFLMAGAEHQAIASKLVKEIARLGGDVSKFVTPPVRDALSQKLGQRGK